MSKLIKLTSINLLDVVEIHKEAFPNFFLTELGDKLLYVFYSSLLKETTTIAWCFAEENKVVGFFVATTRPSGLYRKIFLKNFFSFSFRLMLVFLKKPKYLKKMIISYSTQINHRIPVTFTASLLSICVHPNFAGKKIGKRLLEKLEIELKKTNELGYYLTTDNENNSATNQFYLINGFELLTVFRQGNRIMNLYTKLV
jgi:GNAT superfamily N-acetyltransferase